MGLTGYETVTTFKSDFNVVQSFWYDVFLPGGGSKPGTLCEPHVLNIGDSFTTNYSLFEWKLVTASSDNQPSSSLVYKGWTLHNCDIVRVFFNGDLRTLTVDAGVTIVCTDSKGFLLMAETSFSMTELPGKTGSMLLADPAAFIAGYLNVSAHRRSRAIVLDSMSVFFIETTCNF